MATEVVTGVTVIVTAGLVMIDEAVLVDVVMGGLLTRIQEHAEDTRAAWLCAFTTDVQAVAKAGNVEARRSKVVVDAMSGSAEHEYERVVVVVVTKDT